MVLLSADIQWWEVVGLLFGGGGITAIVIFGLKWIRFSRSDKQDVNIKRAQVDKLTAEASETKAKGEVSVADAALRWAERLTAECNKTKEQLDKAERDLDTALNSLRDATIKMSEAQHELKNERQKNIFMADQIEKLTIEVQKYKTNNQTST